DIADVFVFAPAQKFLVASSVGKGFFVMSDDVVASTKNGKQVLNLPEGALAIACRPGDGDHIAVVGTNRKLLIFPVTEVPEMKRGQGVALQKYKGAGMSDVKVFTRKEGLSWKSGDRVRTETDMRPWAGHRGTAGHLPPPGFPRSNRFE